MSKEDLIKARISIKKSYKEIKRRKYFYKI